MTWMRCIGGHAHDRWYDVDTRSRGLVVPEIRSVKFVAAEELNPLAEKPPMTLYTIERLIWPGFRFPIRVLLASDVKIKGIWTEYDSSWPNPLVQPRCRCEEIPAFPPWVFGRENRSACHLDHCPIHGRYTFPPITPITVSLNARTAWLLERRGIAAGHDPL